MDKKFLASIVITVLALGWLVFVPKDNPQYANVILIAQVVVTFMSAWIGLSAAKYFTKESVFGKALTWISAGLIAWGVGNIAWWYYVVFAGENIPYPSFADFGYLLTIPLAAYGLFLFVKNIDFTFDKKTILKIIILPLIVLVGTYFLFIQGALGEDQSMLVNILNVAYPVGDIIFLSFALVILTVTYGSVLFKPFAVLSLGFIIEAAADFTFSYTTANETFYTGSISDVLFILAFFTLGAGMYYLMTSNKAVSVVTSSTPTPAAISSKLSTPSLTPPVASTIVQSITAVTPSKLHIKKSGVKKKSTVRKKVAKTKK